jgi:hypothetical protein
MDYYMTIVRGLILSVTLASIFAVFVVTILKIMRRAGFSHGKTAVLVAVSLSLLFLVALSQFFIGPGNAYHAAGSDNAGNAVARYVLPPGIALGVAAAVLLSQILLLASRARADEQPESLAKKPERPVRSKPSGRPKKVKTAETEPKEASKPSSSASQE